MHTGHEVVPGPAWPPLEGERGAVAACVVSLEDPAAAPTRLTVRAVVRCDRGELATVDVTLMTLGGAPVTDRLRFARETLRVALCPTAVEAAWLAEREWLGDAVLRPASGS